MLAAFLGEIDTRPGREGEPRRSANVQFASNTRPFEKEVLTVAAGMIWEPNERTRIETKYAVGHGNDTSFQVGTNSSVDRNDRPFVQYDFGTGDDIPDIILVESADADSQAPTSVADGERIDLANLGTYTLTGTSFVDQFRSNNERALTINVDREVEWGSFTSTASGTVCARTTTSPAPSTARSGSAPSPTSKRSTPA